MDLFQIIFLIFLGFVALVAWLAAGEHYIVAGIIVAIVVGIGYLLFRFFAWSLEYGFRNKYPLDYLRNIGWVTKKFHEAGFICGEYISPGTDYPGIYMEKDDTKVSIMLKADKFPYKIECIDANGVKRFSIDEKPTETTEQIVDDVIKSM